ncbi:TPA: acyltransferase family protein, partial [Enterococcus faecium]|nr:acyltransferase family protein [Enterococcus faecium]
MVAGLSTVAVPTFFIISSFLLCSGEVTSAKLSKQIYRVLKIYIIWSILYIPLVLKNWVQSDFSWKTDVLLYIRDFLFIGSYYHLWFLPALAFA